VHEWGHDDLERQATLVSCLIESAVSNNVPAASGTTSFNSSTDASPGSGSFGSLCASLLSSPPATTATVNREAEPMPKPPPKISGEAASAGFGKAKDRSRDNRSATNAAAASLVPMPGATAAESQAAPANLPSLAISQVADFAASGGGADVSVLAPNVSLSPTSTGTLTSVRQSDDSSSAILKTAAASSLASSAVTSFRVVPSTAGSQLVTDSLGAKATPQAPATRQINSSAATASFKSDGAATQSGSSQTSSSQTSSSQNTVAEPPIVSAASVAGTPQEGSARPTVEVTNTQAMDKNADAGFAVQSQQDTLLQDVSRATPNVSQIPQSTQPGAGDSGLSINLLSPNVLSPDLADKSAETSPVSLAQSSFGSRVVPGQPTEQQVAQANVPMQAVAAVIQSSKPDQALTAAALSSSIGNPKAAKEENPSLPPAAGSLANVAGTPRGTGSPGLAALPGSSLADNPSAIFSTVHLATPAGIGNPPGAESNAVASKEHPIAVSGQPPVSKTSVPSVSSPKASPTTSAQTADQSSHKSPSDATATPIAPQQSSSASTPATMIAAGPSAGTQGTTTPARTSTPAPTSGDPGVPGSARNLASSAGEPGASVHVGPVQMAQMVSKASQSEMRIGLNTSAFGSVEVRTVVHASDVGLVIGSEKGDLHSLLANEIPAISNTLQQQNLRLNEVNFHQGFAFSNNLSSGSDSQPRSFAQAAPSTHFPAGETGRDDSTEPAMTETSIRHYGGISILA